MTLRWTPRMTVGRTLRSTSGPTPCRPAWLARWSTGCLLAASLVACGSTPSTTFYTLNIPSNDVRPANERPLYQLAIGPVSVPDYVDRPQLVVRTGPNEQRVLEQRRWVQPVAREIDSTLAASLARKLDRGLVTTLGQSAAASANYRVAIDVLRFDSEPGREIQFEALWTLRDRQGRTLDGGVQRTRAPVGAPGFDALVAAHSAAIDQLATVIADSVKRLPPPPIDAPKAATAAPGK